MPCTLHKVLYILVSFTLLCSFPLGYHIISFIKNDFIHSFAPTLNSNCISLLLFSIIVNLFNLSLVPRFFLQSFAYFSHFSARYVISHNLKLASYLLNFGTLRFARYQMLIVFTISWFHLRSSPKSAQCTQHSAVGTQHEAKSTQTSCCSPLNLLLYLLLYNLLLLLQRILFPSAYIVIFNVMLQRLLIPEFLLLLSSRRFLFRSGEKGTTTETIIQKYIKLQLLLP